MAKKSKTRILDLYFRQKKLGSLIHYFGLCFDIQQEISWEEKGDFRGLMAPMPDDYIDLVEDQKDPAYWGSDSKHEKGGELTLLRENLLLLYAAYKGEL